MNPECSDNEVVVVAPVSPDTDTYELPHMIAFEECPLTACEDLPQHDLLYPLLRKIKEVDGVEAIGYGCYTVTVRFVSEEKNTVDTGFTIISLIFDYFGWGAPIVHVQTVGFVDELPEE